MNFKIYIPEKIKNKHQQAAVKEYEKRLSRYCKIKTIIYKDETELEKLPSKTYKIRITPQGDTITSEALADKINHLGVTGKSDVTFIIHDSIDSNEILALSKMDLSVGMTTTVLYEQIYRGFRINNNEPYHK